MGAGVISALWSMWSPPVSMVRMSSHLIERLCAQGSRGCLVCCCLPVYFLPCGRWFISLIEVQIPVMTEILCMSVYVGVCLYVYVLTCVSLCVSVYIHIDMCVFCVCVSTCIYIDACVCRCTCTEVCLHVEAKC